MYVSLAIRTPRSESCCRLRPLVCVFYWWTGDGEHLRKPSNEDRSWNRKESASRLDLSLPSTEFEFASNGTDVCREDHWVFFFFFCGPKVIGHPVAISQNNRWAAKRQGSQSFCSFKSTKEGPTRERRWHSCRNYGLPVNLADSYQSVTNNRSTDSLKAKKIISESWWWKKRVLGFSALAEIKSWFLRLVRTFCIEHGPPSTTAYQVVQRCDRCDIQVHKFRSWRYRTAVLWLELGHQTTRLNQALYHPSRV